MKPGWKSLITASAACVLMTTSAACSSGDDGSQPDRGSTTNPQTSAAAALLEPATPEQIVDHFVQAGLPATDLHDVTDSECPEAHCMSAAQTAETTVMKFDHPRDTMMYYATHRDAFAIADIVVSFSGDVDADARKAYERQTTLAVR